MITKMCLSEVLQEKENISQGTIVVIDHQGREKSIGYQELYKISKQILFNLETRGFAKGDEVIFQIDSEENFIYFTWACILGGMVAVPLPNVKNQENIRQLARIWRILRRPKMIATEAQLAKIVEILTAENELEIATAMKRKTFFTADLLMLGETGRVVLSNLNDTAFIVFSSGSTGEPKGIVLTNEKILEAMESMAAHFQLNASDVFLNWMPLTHVIGLVLFHVLPLAYEKTQVIIAKEWFIKNPVTWLTKAERYKATILIAPNIGFRQFLSSFHAEPCHLDLSRIRTLMASAEPVSGDLAEQFLTTLAKFGLKKEALANLYGMSESVLGIACTLPGQQAQSYWLDREFLGVGDPVKAIQAGSADGSLFVSSGVPIPNCWVRICDDCGNVLGENYIGHVQVTGKNIINRYYTDEATAKSFTQDGWLISGDIGFLKNGQLTITGRAKDLIIVNGQNFYASDLERVAEKVGKLDFGTVAACGIFIVQNQAEKAVLFVENHRPLPEFIPLLLLLKNQLSQQMGIEIFRIIPVSEIPKTGSGKIQRYKLAREYQDGKYQETEATLEALIATGLSQGGVTQPESDLQEQLLAICRETLHYPEIGIDDNLFDYGLHSITMAAIITRINNSLQADLSFTDFISSHSVRALERVILGPTAATHFQYPQSTPNPTDLHQPFPLTAIQEAYLIGRNEAIEMGGVCTHFYQEIETEYEIASLSRCLQKLIAAYPMMRAIVSGTKMQTILETVPDYQIIEIDLRHLSEAEQQAIIATERDRMSHYVFATDRWPLFEFKALKLTDRKNYLFVSYDLMIADAASILTIGKNLVDLCQNPDLTIVTPDFSFRDYVLTYTAFKTSDLYRRDHDYWQKKLANFPDTPALPYKNSPEKIKKPYYRRLEKRFNRQQWSAIKTIAGSKRITASAVLCAAFMEVLAFWSNQPDLAINLTTFNTLPFHQDATRILGDFTSVLPLGVHFDRGDSFWSKAAKLQGELMEVLEHRHYDGVEVLRDLARFKNIGIGKPVLPIVFSSILFEEGRFGWSELGEIKFAVSQTPQVFIDVQIMEDNAELAISWDYVEQLFDEEVITQLFGQYLGLLEGIARGREANRLSISQSDLSLIRQYNSTEAAIAARTLHGLFKEAVRRTPGNVAVIHENERLTYRELDERSDRIAGHLSRQGVGRGDYVGVLAHRRIETIINILGILKAGAAYIPLNPEHPEERRSYILEDAGARIQLRPETYAQEEMGKSDGGGVNDYEHPDDVAYVIYTSGSTGRPKGVVIKHQAAANTIVAINDQYKVDEADRIIGLSSLCFDLSVYDIFGALAAGAALVIIADQREPGKINAVLQKHGITIWNSVPAIMELLLDHCGAAEEAENSYRNSASGKEVAASFGDDGNDSLRLVMLSGDWIPLALPGKIKNRFANAEVISLGGATEASIWSIYYPVGEVAADWKSVPYGMPLPNQTFYVLNYENELCPVGVAGELYIGGAGLAEGYLNDQAKTEAAFISHPQLGRLYKTGDYGALRREGWIEFLGRQDQQVKIRGYRVELGEIESRLLEYEGVKGAVVVDRTDGRKYLCAYLVAGPAVVCQAVRQYLERLLPDYMVPSYLVKVNEIPLSANGKVDRKALPEPEERAESGVEYVAPTNEIETKLAEIWRDLLDGERIGVNDNFFDLGGNSVTMVRIITGIGREFGVALSYREFMENNTVAKLAELISDKGAEA